MNFAKQYMRILLIIHLLLFISLCSQAQLPVLKHFTVEDGLPSSNIYNAFEDSRGYMWFCTDKGITRFDGYNFEVFDMDGINAASDVWGINEDRDGRLWLSTFNHIVYFEKNEFQAIPLPKDFKFNMVQRHFFDKNGNHFINFVNALGMHQVKSPDSLELSLIKFPAKIGPHNLFFLKKDELGQHWFSRHTNNELELYVEKGDSLHLFRKITQETQGFFYHEPIVLADSTFAFLSKTAILHFDFKTIKTTPLIDIFQEPIEILPKYTKDGKHIFLWTNKGIRVLDKNWQVQPNFEFLNNFNNSFVLEDQKENTWICTKNDGLYMLPRVAKSSIHLNFSENNADNAILAMTMSDDQQLWMGTGNGQVNIMNKQFNFRPFDIQIPSAFSFSEVVNQAIVGLCFDAQGNLYIGYQKGILLIIPVDFLTREKLTIQDFYHNKNNRLKQDFTVDKPTGIKTIGAIKAISKTEDNSILVTTSSGIHHILCENNRFYLNHIHNRRTYDVVIFQGEVWLGNKKGITKHHLDNSTTFEKGKPTIFKDPINDLVLSLDKKLWIGTDGNGLYRYDGQRIDSIAELKGKSEIIKSLYIDKANNLWVSTNKGIAKISILSEQPFQYHFQKITEAYGLATGEVNQLYVKNGLIYAATNKGLTILEESVLDEKMEIPPLYFTQVMVNEQHQSLQKNYELAHEQNRLLIRYLCLSYESLVDIEYQYWMEGIDTHWQTTKAIEREYAALAPDEYTFRLRAKDIGGQWTPEQRLNITIHPPWWKTSSAYVLYFLLVLMAFYAFYNYQFKKYLKRQKIQRIKEMNALKSRFYTNITHEFRTPLTIILGFTKRLKEQAPPTQVQTLSVMERHGRRLLNLINQLLDLNKLEAGAMPIQWQNDDMIAYIQYLVGLFESAAADKEIQLTFYKEVDSQYMDFDADKIQTIFYNLLSNAIKFTPASGEIIVHVTKSETENALIIKIKDNGEGIRSEILALIFNRFYQDSQTNQESKGTGIGLALAKELTEQMGGTIEVESNANGTLFCLQFPIKQTAEAKNKFLSQEEIAADIAAFFPKKIAASNQLTAHDADKNLPVLLIVEDNVDLSAYLQVLIKDTYQIILTKDGKEGIEKALEIVPDLIISDIMMPQTDGLELCATLKKDERTSHIPIILLTGKSSPETKLKGLEYGADMYLVKPFEEKELLLRLKNLNELRQKIQQRYTDFALSSQSDVADTAAINKEDVFLQKVRAIVEENIDNLDLDVNKLCQLVAMSRSQLHKKITALTGKSTTHFIKNIRLRKAKELLQTTDLPIAEIAFQTGFEAQYFSTVFSRTFGQSPTAFRKQVTGQL